MKMAKFVTRNISIIVLELVLSILLGCQPINPAPENPTSENQPQSKTEEYVDITIASVGDILIHNTLYYAAYQPSTDSYDFKKQFQYVKPYLEEADIAIANLETTLAGPEHGYSSYPKFNSPDTIIDALQYAGIDILTAANNHRMDTGVSGFYRTIDIVRDKGLDLIGVKAHEQEETYVLKEIKGVKTAFLNFGYVYPQWDGSVSINGLPLPAKMSNLFAGFDPQDLDISMEALEQQIAKANKAGAQIIIVFMHWGDEYHRLPNDFQKQLASNLVSLGVDAIFGGHPHVLQPAVYLTSPEGKKIPVFYSQGNFISDQRKETVDDVYTEQGIIAKVTFRVQKSEDKISSAQPSAQPEPFAVEVIKAEAIPTWVNKKMLNNRFHYEIIPAEEALASQDKFPLLDAYDLGRIGFCRDTAEEISQGLKD